MNHFTLRQIECFLEVCRDLSFSRAASRLNMAQPPLSRHIRELESTLGCRLFERSSRKVALTSAGMAFLEHSCTIPQCLNKAADAARRTQAGERSRLRIGFVSAILNDRLFEAFRSFRIQHPTCRLELTDSSPTGLIEKLALSELDGAFLGMTVSPLPSFLEQLHWRSEPLRVCVPLEHVFSQRERIRMRDLEGASFVTLSAQTAPSFRNFVDALMQKFKVSVNTVQEADSVPALLSLVVAGSGLALLPGSAVVLAKDYLATCVLEEAEAVLHEVFVYRKSNRPAIEPLLQLLPEHH